MGKLIVTLTILGLVLLLFAGFDALDKYLTHPEGGRESNSTTLSQIEVEPETEFSADRQIESAVLPAPPAG